MILLYLFITNVLTRPIRSLEAVIEQVEGGDLGARVAPSGSDEVSGLARSFDLLMDRIELLLKEVVRDQEELKKMELRTLQAQINPHFLYNTLDAIVWMAEAGKKEEIVQMAKSLSSFFRLSLSRGEDWIQIEEEVAHVLSYLSIQKTRYRDILDYRVRVDDKARGMKILKLILQPLVENAVYHGVKNKRGGGTILIEIEHRDENSLLIRVEDDGAGMNPERLEAVRRVLALKEFPGDAGPGYGLRNIRRRLELYYGGGSNLDIDARTGGGTVVTIVLPASTGGSL
jgi:two-component system sensor histidine kinase YesM